MDPSAGPRLSIDLNLAPPPPLDAVAAVFGGPEDAYLLACQYHSFKVPPASGPAEFPGEAGIGPTYMLCSVCDLPESRGNTIVCDACERGFHLGCARIGPPLPEDWLCGECLMSGRINRRWKLGPTGLLDINAAPTSANGDLLRSRLNNSLPAGGYGEQFAQCKLGRLQTTSGLGNNSRIADNVVGTSLEDGRAFESLLFAAQYVGMNSNVDLERSDGLRIPCGSLPIRRRKKELIRPRNDASSNQEKGCLKTLSLQEHSLFAESTENHSSDAQRHLQSSKTCAKENSGLGSQDLYDALPVQYEDFFVISLGKIDLRTAYHGSNRIWPIGYTSIWHDRLTGSLFECQVADGGNSGPVFKVSRFPCSALPIPHATTILVDNDDGQEYPPERPESDSSLDDDIMLLFSDPVQPDEELFSGFSNNDTISRRSSDSNDTPEQDALSDKMDLDKNEEDFDTNSSMRDEIGEFYVEGRSSSSAWKMVAQTLIIACIESFKHSGSLQFHCRHQPLDLPSIANGFSPLARFSPFVPSDAPRVIKSNSELYSSCKSIAAWLNKDRFGLDMAFVQEIIEALPESNDCSSYEYLFKRTDFSLLPTVASGRLLVMQKTGVKGKLRSGLDNMYKRKPRTWQDLAAEDRAQPPPGKKLSNKLPSELLGDVLQIWQFFCRFYEILGLKEPPSFEQLVKELIDPWPICSKSDKKIVTEMHDTGSTGSFVTDCSTNRFAQTSGGSYMDGAVGSQHFVPNGTSLAREASAGKLASLTFGRCTGVVLTKIHISLLKLLIVELLSKVTFFVDQNTIARESKPSLGRKKDAKNSFPAKKLKNDILCINELTWPELARRYVLVLSFIGRCMDSPDLFNRDGMKLLRCLQGDGGVLCGSLSGVAGMEADAMLLAEAQKQIYDPRNRETELFVADHKELDAPSAPETSENEKCLPDWAVPLEPVRKLPTNVGTRIRRCVYDALDKSPPEWARKILVHSISKEVYKGNASGPTKKAVLSVLAEASGGSQQIKSEKRKKEKNVFSLSDAIMRKCRIILRRVIAADDAKHFCNLLGSTLANINDDEDEGVLGFPAMVSRPLDFRVIDLRLAFGAYAGSHEAFLEDVREVWHNIRVAYGDRNDVLLAIEMLSQNFEELFENEVLNLVQKVADCCGKETIESEKQQQLNEIIGNADELPKAPWEVGVCKICGIDKDRDCVLLCDTCDSEYHIFCLNPPLARIPEGNWYCQSCVRSQSKRQNSFQHVQVVKSQTKRHVGEEAFTFQENLNQLAVTMAEREYWEFSTEERILLLKILSDEVLNTGTFREHLEQCIERSSRLQQKLSALVVESGNLELKEETLATTARGTGSRCTDDVREERAAISNPGWVESSCFQQIDTNDTNHTGDVPNSLEGALSASKSCQEGGQNDLMKNVDLLYLTVVEPSKEPEALIVDNYGLGKTSSVGHESTMTNSSEGENQRQDEGCLAFSPQCDLKPMEGHIIQSVVNEPAEERLASTTDESIVNEGNPGMLINAGELIPAFDSEKLQSNTINLSACRDSRVEISAELPEISQESVVQEKTVAFHGISIESGSTDLALSKRNEIVHLEESIPSLENQIMTSSLRREFIGKDSLGRLYWVLSRPGKRPWLVADESMPTPHERYKSKRPRNTSILNDLGSSGSVSTRHRCPGGSTARSTSALNLTRRSFACAVYESDEEIQELASWLKETDPLEKDLKEYILHWQRHLPQQGKTITSEPLLLLKSSMNQHSSSEYMSTKARTILEAKYGPLVEPDVSEIRKEWGKRTEVSFEERIYRCECLELIWASRCHCLSCHQTFSSVSELGSHNDGKCVSNNPDQDESTRDYDTLKTKGARTESASEKEHLDETISLDIGLNVLKPRKSSPFDLNDTCGKFVVTSSKKQVVQEIGIVGLNEIPTLVPSPVTYSALLLNQNHQYNIDGISRVTPMGGCFPAKKTKINSSDSDMGKEVSLVQSFSGNGNFRRVLGAKVSAIDAVAAEQKSSITKRMHRPEVGRHGFTISESSLRPVVGKNAEILKWLKMSLLDMDAALPNEALKPSKSNLPSRCAWRSFVKCAESVFEMIQAAMLFEGMIKSEYLKNDWWYWSSQTAAAKTSTISYLALRIYTLDGCIIYAKGQVPGPETVGNTNKMEKMKDVEVGS